MCNQHLTVLAQRDARWSRIPLGNSKASTIGAYGCLLTCLAMMVDATPDKLNAELVKAGAFLGANDWCPACLRRPFDVRQWLGRGPRYVRQTERFPTKPFPAGERQRLLEHLQAGHLAIVEVDMAPAALEGQHFVLAVGAFGAPGQEQIVISDPWHGDQVPLVPRYGRNLGAAIVGAIYYMED